MSLKEESEDESLSESETEDVELEEIEEIDAGIQDPKLLKDHITRIRQVHQNAVKQLHTEKSKVKTAKKTIAGLISQIKEYKEALESEKTELEAEISELTQQLEKQKQLSFSLELSIDQVQKEKVQLSTQISSLEKRHEAAIEEESKLMAAMKKETYENLQTLMEELKRIEEANEKLRDEQEKLKLQIQEERSAHQNTLLQLVTEKVKVEENKTSLETLRLTNQALITQLTQVRKASITLKNSQQIRLSNSPPTERRRSLNSESMPSQPTTDLVYT